MLSSGVNSCLYRYKSNCPWTFTIFYPLYSYMRYRLAVTAFVLGYCLRLSDLLCCAMGMGMSSADSYLMLGLYWVGVWYMSAL